MQFYIQSSAIHQDHKSRHQDSPPSLDPKPTDNSAATYSITYHKYKEHFAIFSRNETIFLFPLPTHPTPTIYPFSLHPSNRTTFPPLERAPHSSVPQHNQSTWPTAPVGPSSRKTIIVHIILRKPTRGKINPHSINSEKLVRKKGPEISTTASQK